jgi:hypothetical protein
MHAEALRRRPHRGIGLCGCVLAPRPMLMFGFITFCDCKHAERRLFFLVGFVFAGASLRIRICLPAREPRWQQSRPKHLSRAESFGGGGRVGDHVGGRLGSANL